jgi:hypothetical protein
VLWQAVHCHPPAAADPAHVELAPLLSGARLASGAQLTVSVAKANTVGRVWLFTIRGGRGPSLSTTCLKPGSSVPGKGCTLR